MKIEQIYTSCLAHGAYYIEDDGEVAIIDPLRDTQSYIEKAKKDDANIKYVFETHFHADFVSGHLDLADKTGATIVYGPTAEPKFKAYVGKDNETFKLGRLTITLLHTPGHTMESSTFLLKDANDKEIAIFSGDTLFIGDVGRPDLVQKFNNSLTQDKLAGLLYDSLHNKIMNLADDIIVYPAHGAGSACGKNISNKTSDTLGNQKKTNYALDKNLNKQQFIEKLTTGLMPSPFYFTENVLLNKNGCSSLEAIKAEMKPLNLEDFLSELENKNALILDVRDPLVFGKSFIPGSINIGLNGRFASWVGTLITDITQPILLIVDEGLEIEALERLSRVGYDNVIGYLKGGFKTWIEANKGFDEIINIPPDEVFEIIYQTDLKILDVRRPNEYAEERLDNTISMPLDFINACTNLINKDETYLVYCSAGYRSMIFISILKARGFENLINVEGGYSQIKKYMPVS